MDIWLRRSGRGHAGRRVSGVRGVLVLATRWALFMAAACGSKTPPNAPAASLTATDASDPHARALPAGRSTVSKPIQAAVDAPDRAPEDRALDVGRHPAEILSYYGVGPGMRVAELAAGTGYTSELLARVVGPSGVVFGQNSPWLLARFAERPWSARLVKHVMNNVIRADREFESPLPEEAKDLDIVFDILFYHDTFWLKVDRAKMNRAVFAALRPGGVYAIIDHSARAGVGANDVQTLHRIEESVVIDEVLKAGFRFAGESDILRNAADPRDWNDAPSAAASRRGTSDRFVLKFVKP